MQIPKVIGEGAQPPPPRASLPRTPKSWREPARGMGWILPATSLIWIGRLLSSSPDPKSNPDSPRNQPKQGEPVPQKGPHEPG